MFSWLKDKWNRFQNWVSTWMPGLKTKLATGLGAVGMAAGVAQEYITGLPLSTFMTATEIAIASAVLFTLSFWFRSLANREDA